MADSPAAAIVKAVGGPANIESLSHCATRLRFQLRDATGVDKSVVEAIPGVMAGVPQAGDRYQIVIGGGVQKVYQEINALPGMAAATGGGGAPTDPDAIKAAERSKGPRGKAAWLDNLFEFLSDSFRPILGALMGASLFITFMALMATLDVIPAWNSPGVVLSPSWAFVNLMWQCVFTFLPLMVAYNASAKIGADPWVGFAIMGVLMLPQFRALGEGIDPTKVFGVDVTIVDVWGLPLTVFDYSQQVFPPLLMAALLGPLYMLLRRVIPESLHLIFVPFFAMLIMIPLTAFLIGPIGVYAGAGLANVLKSINDFSPFIFAIVIPMAYPFMVPLGLHWPINAVMLLNIQTLGYDFIQGPMGAWNFSCFGATAGVLFLAWKQRDQQMKEVATGALAAGLLGGISEPSLYGIHLRFKRIYPRMLVGCFVGGLIVGIGGGVTTNAFVFTSLLTIPAFSPIAVYGVAVIAAFAVSMTLIVLSGFRTPEQQAEFEASRVPVSATMSGEASKESVATMTTAATTASVGTALLTRTIEITAPLDGTVIPIEDVPDPVFASKAMGPGAAIQPTGNTVVAPGAGVVATAATTGHAFGLVLDGGVEVLIHVGIDTVNLNGEGFDVKVAQGDRVEAGAPLVTFDRAVIDKAGYSMVTPVIVLNSHDFGEITPILEGRVSSGDPLISVDAKETDIPDSV